MNIPGAFLAAAVFGATLGSATLCVADDGLFLRLWSTPGISVRERAEAVNHFFANGTPIRVIVAALGTKYVAARPISSVWVGSEPEPRKTCSLDYSFGENAVIIDTSVDIAGDPLTGEFTGAGYSVTRSTETTNRIWIGPQDGAANGSQPIRLLKGGST